MPNNRSQAARTNAAKKAAASDKGTPAAKKAARAPSVDALAGLDLTVTTGVDVPDTLRRSVVPNPFDGVVKQMADALRANDNKVVKDKGASTFSLPGAADADKNAALKQAILKLNKAGANNKVSVVKSLTASDDGKSVTVLFFVRPRITRKTASSPAGLASGAGDGATS